MREGFGGRVVRGTAALAQVRAKQYDAPYRAKNLPIWLIGLNFDRETRQLVDAKSEKA